jgi:hypothetical protein
VSVGVITSIYGGYDQLAIPPVQTIDTEWVCVTDDPTLDGGGVWKVIHEPRPDLPARLAAKVAKCLPWLYLSAAHDMLVWMDGSCHLQAPQTLEQLAVTAPEGLVSQFVHPVRQCIYDEAAFSAPLPKYAHQPILEQANHYRSSGHPEQWGLWATGFIVYRMTGAMRRQMGHHWLGEQLRWTNQDQLSQAYVWRCAGSRPVELPGALLANGFVTWTAHADGT